MYICIYIYQYFATISAPSPVGNQQPRRIFHHHHIMAVNKSLSKRSGEQINRALGLSYVLMQLAVSRLKVLYLLTSAGKKVEQKSKLEGATVYTALHCDWVSPPLHLESAYTVYYVSAFVRVYIFNQVIDWWPLEKGH